jgi:hypothetical protein
MIIKVTEEHISRGKCHDAQRCAVALAIHDAVDSPYVAVGTRMITCVGYHHAVIPTDVKAWISRFDRALPVEPFEFELELVSCN